jgi:hypothetical protein
MRVTGSLAVLAGLLIVTAPASGQLGGTDLIKWPQLLPPLDVPNDVRAHPVKHCRKASVRCVAGLQRRLRRQWRRFHSACDHRAVIAYSYLQITKGLRKDMAGPRPGLVRNRRWMAYLITTFSNRYFAAFRDYDAGRPVDDSWRITFETAAAGDAQAGQEVLLFSNAHVQHDLPFAYEEMGLRTRSGRSRKPDHDSVNEVNARVFDRIEKYVADHYDPSFGLIDIPLVPLEEIGTLELVKLWREGAWRNAERLLNADTAAERRDVVTSIEATSRLWAQLISAAGIPGYHETRDAYCESHP